MLVMRTRVYFMRCRRMYLALASPPHTDTYWALMPLYMPSNGDSLMDLPKSQLLLVA